MAQTLAEVFHRARHALAHRGFRESELCRHLGIAAVLEKMQQQRLAIICAERRERILERGPALCIRHARGCGPGQLAVPGAGARFAADGACSEEVCRVVEPARDALSIGEPRRLPREQGKDLLRDIARHLRVAGAPRRGTEHERLVCIHELAERSLIALADEGREQRAVGKLGGSRGHSPPSSPRYRIL